MVILINERADLDLDEMSTLRKNRTGLPVNIWVDDSMLYKRKGRHGMRIKFQPDKGDRPVSYNMVSMTVEDDPQVIETNIKTSLSVSDINKIKSFIKANKDLLVALSDMKIDIVDFVAKMKK